MIEIKNISKSYEGHQALSDVTLKINSNTIFGLLGPNGAGKTTLIRTLSQIIKQDSGEILLDGKPMGNDHRNAFGYLPEERGLYKKMKVLEHLLYIARLRGMAKSAAKESAIDWLKKLDLYQWKDRWIEDLSKGMQQKVQFINSIVHQPKIIILDEPFSGFDPVNAEQIKKEIRALKSPDRIVILSTHRMESVEELCDDIALINRSKCILQGNVSDIKKEHSLDGYLITLRNRPEDLDASNLVEHNIEKNEYLLENKSLDELVQKLPADQEIISAHRRIPTIEEIFLKLVSPQNG